MIREARNNRMRNHNIQSMDKYLHRSCIVVVLFIGISTGQTAQFTKALPKIDRTEFQRQGGPVTSAGVTGVMEGRSGSLVRQAQLVRNSFALADGSKGGVSVEIVTFPKGYRDAPHDLFGSLLGLGAHDRKRVDPSDNVHCVEWEYADHGQGGTVCYTESESTQKHDGAVCWYNGNVDEGFVTVRIGYSNLDGLPGQVIEKYLREYPSDVRANPTWQLDWETKDIEKWTELLRAYKDDVPILRAGAVYLTRYEKRSFGLLDALRKRDDTVAFSQALNDVVERMSRAVAERKEKAREPGNRGD